MYIIWVTYGEGCVSSGSLMVRVCVSSGSLMVRVCVSSGSLMVRVCVSSGSLMVCVHRDIRYYHLII